MEKITIAVFIGYQNTYSIPARDSWHPILYLNVDEVKEFKEEFYIKDNNFHRHNSSLILISIEKKMFSKLELYLLNKVGKYI